MKNASSDRWVAYIVAVTAAAVVLLLGLQRFGIWQPSEIHLADLARDTLAGQSPRIDRPPAQVTAVLLGFRIGGITELWGRLPTALLAFASLGALMAAARGAGDRRLAVYTGVAYATLPLVFLNARQMMGAGVAQSAFTLALAGLVLACWGKDARWRAAGGVIGAVGLVLAARGAGVLLGVVPVLGAIGLAAMLRFGREARVARIVGAASLALGAVLAFFAVRAALQGVAMVDDLAGMAPDALARMRRAMLFWVGATPEVRAATQWTTFEAFIEQVGHATFPWTGFVPFGLVRLVSPPSRPAPGAPDVLDADEVAEHDAWREAGLRLAAFLAVALAFAVQTFHMQLYGMSAFIAVAPLALGLGVLLRDCEREARPWRTVAVGAALLTLLMLRDYLQFPKSAYAAFGLADGGPTFPSGFQAKPGEWLETVRAALRAGGSIPPPSAEVYYAIQCGLFLVLGILVVFQGAGEVKPFGWFRPYQWTLDVEREARASRDDERKAIGRTTIGTFILMNVRVSIAILMGAAVMIGAIVPRAVPRLPTPTLKALNALMASPVLIVVGAFAVIAVWNFYAWLGRAGNKVNALVGSRVWWVPMAGFLVAVVATQGFIPALSEHMSPRGVWAVVRAMRVANEPVARYGGPSEDPATRYYTQVQPTQLTSDEAAVDWLTGPQRRFLVVGADVFPRVNSLYRARAHRNVPVADASNSNLYLAASDLGNRPDVNPLNRWVLDRRPAPTRNDPDWTLFNHPAREPAVLNDAIEYIGYGLDSNNLPYVPLGGSFKVTFNFRVLRQVSGSWQMFVHTDGQGPRINGDHEPVNGKYPLNLWQPGDYIRDQITVNIPMTYRPGVYTVFMGFFQGDERMRVVGGDHDRDNRVVVARINVR